MASPTIILITDRTDLDDQLSNIFTNAKTYIGDDEIISVESRAELREKLKDRKSGGVFLTTIRKFTEDLALAQSVPMSSVSRMKRTVAKSISSKKLPSLKMALKDLRLC